MITEVQVNEHIKKFCTFFVSNIAISKDNKYAGFILDLDRTEKEKRFAIGGTSLGLLFSSYNEIGVIDNHYKEKMYNFIISKQLETGNWTISSLSKYNESLIYTTCFAIQSLIRFNQNSNTKCENYISKGIKWLVDNVNNDGGWGLTPSMTSHIHSTSEAIFTLNIAKNFCKLNLDSIIEDGINWLLKYKKENIWENENKKKDIFFTALAYRAIITSNNICFINKLEETKDELINSFNSAKCHKQKVYYITVGDGEEHIQELIGAHEKAMIFNALSYLKDIHIKSVLENQVEYFLNEQTNTGYWTCKNNENQKAPIFLNTEIIIGLINFKNFFLNNTLKGKSINNNNTICKKLDNKLYLNIAILLILIGVFCSINFIINNIDTQFLSKIIKFINDKYEKYSGIANFLAIISVIIAIIKFLISKIKK